MNDILIEYATVNAKIKELTEKKRRFKRRNSWRSCRKW